jgi:hypothetical protein
MVKKEVALAIGGSIETFTSAASIAGGGRSEAHGARRQYRTRNETTAIANEAYQESGTPRAVTSPGCAWTCSRV